MMKNRKLILRTITTGILIFSQCDKAVSHPDKAKVKTAKLVSFGGWELSEDIDVISLSARRIRSEDISSVNKFKNLKTLSLAENPITSIEVLRGNKSINDLTLSYTYVSDLSPLSENEQLESLSVIFSKVRRIEMLPKTLKELVIDETIEKDSLEAYRKKNPNCKIIIVPMANLNKHLHPERWWEDPSSKVYNHDYLYEK